ncbi:uncharacterized protein LOC112269764 [Brachypodium distachyon]|uniref:uncharacterized protein LOC112269764 n=1 Tax=Brachypodium distachyon TaxID=15368 RepID=UPI00052FE633|nr:uncharacterized protein LOC112269764 [Brachypodium distachyon]|eukprot:XP_024312605.1 uncharacterized protein LOC112269764 [Brachypodium distachyon]
MRERPGAFRAWLMSPALDGLQELELYQRFDDYKMSSPPPPLPGSAFRFSSTLRVATFGQCHISDGPAGKSSSSRFHFPGLKMLALEDSTISEPSLQGLLAGCPVLENLLLKGQELKEVIVEDAPCLERLLRFVPDREVHVSVISAPKLHTLGCLTNMFGVTNLKLDTAAISGLNRVNFTTAVRSVKDLALSAFSLCLDEVINFMGCFPCLERLYIKSGISGGANLWRRKHKNLTKWLDIRLRYIVLANYRGTRSQVSFATFFILNARMLESMRFAVKDGIDIDGGWIEDQHRRLMVEKKASRGAKFDFCENKCRSNSTHVENVRDLSITDPFECTC